MTTTSTEGQTALQWEVKQQQLDAGAAGMTIRTANWSVRLESVRTVCVWNPNLPAWRCDGLSGEAAGHFCLGDLVSLRDLFRTLHAPLGLRLALGVST